MQEKIEQYKNEIEKLKQKKTEQTAKVDEKIKAYQKKIANEQAKENHLIAEIFRTFYGQVTEENIEKFKKDLTENQPSAVALPFK